MEFPVLSLVSPARVSRLASRALPPARGSRLASLALLAFALLGCESIQVNQTNRFINDDGEFITVEYGTGDDVHKSTFVSPANGREMEFESKLRVRVEMPDGERFMAYQCMNMLRSGTMYKSSDEEWMYHANGFICRVFRRQKTSGKYICIYQGVVAQAPVRGTAR